MAKFLFTYRAPEGYTLGSGSMEAWGAFFESLDGHVVERGNPVAARSAVGATVQGTTLGGYSVIEADDLESAATLAKGCPFVGEGGGVEVGELIEM
jgi:hypothetical protein